VKPSEETVTITLNRKEALLVLIALSRVLDDCGQPQSRTPDVRMARSIIAGIKTQLRGIEKEMGL
jgi:hypothetical protein